jgi:hypothetical protein
MKCMDHASFVAARAGWHADGLRLEITFRLDDSLTFLGAFVGFEVFKGMDDPPGMPLSGEGFCFM